MIDQLHPQPTPRAAPRLLARSTLTIAFAAGRGEWPRRACRARVGSRSRTQTGHATKRSQSRVVASPTTTYGAHTEPCTGRSSAGSDRPVAETAARGVAPRSAERTPTARGACAQSSPLTKRSQSRLASMESTTCAHVCVERARARSIPTTLRSRSTRATPRAPVHGERAAHTRANRAFDKTKPIEVILSWANDLRAHLSPRGPRAVGSDDRAGLGRGAKKVWEIGILTEHFSKRGRGGFVSVNCARGFGSAVWEGLRAAGGVRCEVKRRGAAG